MGQRAKNIALIIVSYKGKVKCYIVHFTTYYYVSICFIAKANDVNLFHLGDCSFK